MNKHTKTNKNKQKINKNGFSIYIKLGRRK